MAALADCCRIPEATLHLHCAIGLGACRCSMHRASRFLLALRLCFATSAFSVVFFFVFSNSLDISIRPAPQRSSVHWNRNRGADSSGPKPAMKARPVDPHHLCYLAGG